MATGSIFVAALALPEEQSVAGGKLLSPSFRKIDPADMPAVFQTLIQLGGSFGIAITTVISTAYNERALHAGLAPVDAQLEGLHAAFWLGAGCSLSALIIAMVMLRGMGAIGKVKKEEAVAAESAGAGGEERSRERNDEEVGVRREKA